MSFNFETNRFYTSSDVIRADDNCNFPAFKIFYGDDGIPTTECRCHGHRNFSILTKFSLNETEGAFHLLSLGSLNNTPQFELTFDNCKKEFTMFFNEQCGESTTHTNQYTFSLESSLQKDAWYRFAFEVTDQSISFYSDCSLKKSIEVSREGCAVQCGSSGNNRLLSTIPGSTCGNSKSRRVGHLET